MTNQDFLNAIKDGKKEVIFTDINGKEYTHIIIKGGKKQINLMDTFLKREYKLRFAHFNYPQYRIK